MIDGIDPLIKFEELDSMRDNLTHIWEVLDNVDIDRTNLQAITICNRHLYSARCTIDKYIFTKEVCSDKNSLL